MSANNNKKDVDMIDTTTSKTEDKVEDKKAEVDPFFGKNCI